MEKEKICKHVYAFYNRATIRLCSIDNYQRLLVKNLSFIENYYKNVKDYFYKVILYFVKNNLQETKYLFTLTKIIV